MIEREHYNAWRNHPATLFFRKFIKDRRELLIRGMTEEWLNAPEQFEVNKTEARGRILELFDVEDVPFETIETFYKEQEQDGDEASQAVSR